MTQYRIRFEQTETPQSEEIGVKPDSGRIVVDGFTYAYYVASEGPQTGKKYLRPAIELAKIAILADRQVKQSLLEGEELEIQVRLNSR